MRGAWIWLLAASSFFAVSAAVIGQERKADEPPSILISRQLAESRHLQAGDVVRLSGERSGANARPFRIDGIYEPTPDPMRFAQRRLEVHLHLPDLIGLTSAPEEDAGGDAITSINVALRDRSDATAFARDLTRRLPLLTARAVGSPDERTSTFLVVERFHLAIAIVTVVGSAIFLLALMVMAVEERRTTVGTLRLLGFTRGRILVQVLAEGAVIAAVGAVAGLLFAFAMQDAFNRLFQWRYDTTLIFLRVTPSVVWRSLSLAVPLGMAASLVASWTLLRREILELVRR
jgi:putative ABC transport system permease protein